MRGQGGGRAGAVEGTVDGWEVGYIYIRPLENQLSYCSVLPSAKFTSAYGRPLIS